MKDGDKAYLAKLGGAIIGLLIIGVISLTALAAARWKAAIQKATQEVAAEISASCLNSDDCAPMSIALQTSELVTAKAQFMLAIFQSLISFLGVIGLGVTVFYAHRAWKEAQRSANAALNAFEADNRTWITIRATQVTNLSVKDGVPRLSVQIELRNIGQQPAFDVHPCMQAFVVRGGGIGANTRDKTVEFALCLADIPERQGLTLLGGETHTVNWTCPAEIDPDSHAWLAALFGEVLESRPRIVSVVYCAHYKTLGSIMWRHSAGVTMISMADHTDFPDHGGVNPPQLRAQIIPTLTEMT